MYDQFATDYDRFMNWEKRLPGELPFLESQLRSLEGPSREPVRVLDAACGTGGHVLALARLGYAAAGADLSLPMVLRARESVAQAGLTAQVEAAGFGELAKTFGPRSFDAVLCLGNSLPHLLTQDALTSAVEDFASCLRSHGRLVIQNRNFDAVLAQQERWMEPQVHREGEHEWLFLRFYDFDPDGLITFHVVTLKRAAEGPWIQHDLATRLRPLRQAELKGALEQAGFLEIKSYGSLAGEPFDAVQSGNLVVTSRRK